VVNFAASRLRMEMDRVPLWRGNHVPIRQLVEDFGRFLYLPSLQTTDVLLNAIRSGLALLTWEQDAFAYAESYDEATSRYRTPSRLDKTPSGLRLTSPCVLTGRMRRARKLWLETEKAWQIFVTKLRFTNQTTVDRGRRSIGLRSNRKNFPGLVPFCLG
jgi:hypothetical protein